MKIRSLILETIHAVAVGMIFLVPISSRAAIVDLPPGTPELPGVALTSTAALSGTVIADTTVSFSLATHAYTNGTGNSAPVPICFRDSDLMIPLYLGPRYFAAGAIAGSCPPEEAFAVAAGPFMLTGTLRSIEVERGGGLRDFYYQIANTSELPAGSGHDLFRITIGGFGAGEMLGVGYTDDLSGVSGIGSFTGGTKPPRSADRDVAMPGEIGFDFDLSNLPSFINTNLGGPSNASGNVDSGDVSNFILIRTNRTGMIPPPGNELNVAAASAPSFPTGQQVTIGGVGAMEITALAPVPEPATACLVGIGSIVAASFLTRRRG